MCRIRPWGDDKVIFHLIVGAIDLEVDALVEVFIDNLFVDGNLCFPLCWVISDKVVYCAREDKVSSLGIPQIPFAFSVSVFFGSEYPEYRLISSRMSSSVIFFRILKRGEGYLKGLGVIAHFDNRLSYF